MSDPVNHPAHYNQGAIECIDAIESALGQDAPAYYRGNILKYAWRAGRKDESAQEFRKIEWYARRGAEWMEKQENKVEN